MPDQIISRIHQWPRDHEQELLEDTLAMLRIPSLEGPAEPNAPFGKENRQALDLALSIGERWGMQTKDLEGFAGYAEFGQGERLIMSLGHLDVVPVSDGWKHQPFGAEIDEGYIYARGSVDDKGPTMASFYAMRAIQECAPNLPARMRQVFGCNEESGFKCVERYNQTEEAPTFGIAPDSGWPLYHAEKGIANLHISVPLNSGDLQLLEAHGGQRPNIVIDRSEARVRVSPSVRAHVDEKLADSWDANVAFDWEGDDVLHILTRGKACHGSYPYGGDSAATRLFRFLLEISPLSTATYFEEIFQSMETGGVGLGIHGADEVSHNLTSNIGVMSTEDGRIKLLFNIRYPVTWTGVQLRERCEKHLASLDCGMTLDHMTDSKSLYFPTDHPLVRTIIDVYAEETGERREPGTMGGGTYARAVPNTVSIGTGWEGDGAAHENDERLKVEHLFKMSRIYAHILYRLAIMP